MNFNKDELVQMVYALGEGDRNCLLASRIYRQKFSENRQPSAKAFRRLKNRFEDTGNVFYKKKIFENKAVSNEENEMNVLLTLQENPYLSCRQMEAQLDISKSSVNRIVRKHKYHPYHISLHQDLHGNDFGNRMDFCNFVLHKINQDPMFLSYILFSDEATFKSNGLVNRHNMHYYATENPHWVREIDNQNVWSLNVWAGIINDHVIGPHFFEGSLTGDRYHQFLDENLPILIEEVNLNTRHIMWFQHDGAPPHYYRRVRQYLDNWRGDQWIGRGGPVAWPARSPDLTPLDFFLWGFVKQKVYQEKPTTSQDMKNRIRNVFQTIQRETLSNVRETFIRRLNLCLEQNGQIFEHLVG
jgi:hypothetical protein